MQWMAVSTVWTAASGLILVLFLLLHLAGVALAPLDSAAFEAYAAGLHAAVWAPAAELALLAVGLVHVGFSLSKLIANRRAGNRAMLVSRRGQPLAAFAARSQGLAGLTLLGFLVVHLLQLRWPRPAVGAELAALQSVLVQPASLLLYLAASLALALHLFEAAHRSLGLLNPANGGRIRQAARVLAVLVGGGFVAVALALALPLHAIAGALP
jgi:succinate dehydrogenase / fumarate reductase cytochrome b subunit